ncbi:Actin-related protein 2/3 complex subunit 3 [Castilleja foliolosa]|uniref:Actin-related protein 2/3 complex subunit 3 n=1 Tax=Castilleja foliolosa TaxID=1961234 RepID=A0ABD3C3L6_9LAMI
MVYHSSFVDDEEITKSCGCPLLPLKSHIKGPAPVSEQDSTDIVDEAITFFRANVFFRNFDIKSSADKLLIYLTFYINIALKRLEGCRTLAEGTKAIINLGLEKVPVPGEPGFPFPGLFTAPQSQQEAAVQKLSETDSRGNKRKIIECGLSIQRNSKQMVVGIRKEEVYEHHYTVTYLFDVILRYLADDQNLEA